jgi:hypothetical protein
MDKDTILFFPEKARREYFNKVMRPAGDIRYEDSKIIQDYEIDKVEEKRWVEKWKNHFGKIINFQLKKED